jgi:hypothetical protein
MVGYSSFYFAYFAAFALRLVLYFHVTTAEVFYQRQNFQKNTTILSFENSFPTSFVQNSRVGVPENIYNILLFKGLIFSSFSVPVNHRIKKQNSVINLKKVIYVCLRQRGIIVP